MQRVLKHLRENGSTEGFTNDMVSFKEMFEVVGFTHFKMLEEKYLG